MDRLTHSYLHGGYWASIFKVSACGEDECRGEIIDKLAAYENAEEQGLLLRLPCRVGTCLYMISSRVDGKSHIRRITLTTQNMGNALARIGNDIYATREAAEKALKERSIENGAKRTDRKNIRNI